MTSITAKRVTAKGIAPLKDGIYRGLWKYNIITFGPYSTLNPIIVDKDIYEHGGTQNVRCRVVVKNCTAIATSISIGGN
ncbi:MAG: hypothetical protein AABY15_00630 [Nanoarchaeota archaeon]